MAIQFAPFQQQIAPANFFMPGRATGGAVFNPQQISLQSIMQMLSGLLQSIASLQQGWAGMAGGGQQPQFAQQPQFNQQPQFMQHQPQFMPQFAQQNQAPVFNPVSQRRQFQTNNFAPAPMRMAVQAAPAARTTEGTQANDRNTQANNQTTQANNQTTQTGGQGVNSTQIQSVLAQLKAIDDRPVGPITSVTGVAQFDQKEIEKGNLLAGMDPQLAQAVTAAMLKKMAVKESFYGIPVGSIILPFKLSPDPAVGSRQYIEYMQSGRQLLAASGDNFSKLPDVPWVSQLAALSGN